MKFIWMHYRELNPDLVKAGFTKEYEYINHYKMYGMKEKRNYNIYMVNPNFNWIKYRDDNKSVPKLYTKEQCELHWLINYYNNNIITFITPTIGRNTLYNTIKSVMNQTNTNWNYIIAFDGIDIPTDIMELIKYDKRISYIILPKTGNINFGGMVRNKAMELVTTKWIGFVDDDDTISPYYVDNIMEYIEEYDCIVFRMIDSMNNILPPMDQTDFIEHQVGISFCYKTELFKNGIKFEPGPTEDFMLLNKIRYNNMYKIILSKYVVYFIRSDKNII
jgi:glycosyltransferase involved in cell wall biosynthesis